jgi:magnesium-transporting ATPase (P-type)
MEFSIFLVLVRGKLILSVPLDGQMIVCFVTVNTFWCAACISFGLSTNQVLKPKLGNGLLYTAVDSSQQLDEAYWLLFLHLLWLSVAQIAIVCKFLVHVC